MNEIHVVKELMEENYEVALFSSYSTDLVFFEKVVLRELLSKNALFIGLFVDENCLRESLKSGDQIWSLGKSYVVQPVIETPVFHPKVILLLSSNSAKLIVGSFNLTPAGYLTNYEVGNVFTYHEKKPDTFNNLDIIKAAYHFLSLLHEKRSVSFLDELFNKTKEYGYLAGLGSGLTSPTVFLHNLIQPLHEQIQTIVSFPVQSIEVMVPYFDQQLSVQDRWLNDYSFAEIKYYIQNQTNNFPNQLQTNDACNYYEINFQEEKRRYHGKVFRFKGENQETIVYGSANFSRQALLQSVQQGGNAEVIVTVTGGKGEFDLFFSDGINYAPIDPSQLTTCYEQKDDWKAALPICFLEAYLQDGRLTAKLQTKHPVLTVLIDDNTGEINQEDQIVSVSWLLHSPLSSVFTMEVQLEEVVFLLEGWYQDREELYKTASRKGTLIYDRMQDGSFYSNYQNIIDLLQDFMNRLYTSEDDSNINQKNSLSIHTKSELRESGSVSDDIDDYYVDEEEKTTPYGAIGNRNVLGEIVNRILRIFNGDDEELVVQVLPSPEGERLIKNSNQIELKSLGTYIEKFTKKFNRGLSSDYFIKNVPQHIFLTNIILYTHVLRKLYSLNNKETEIISRSVIVEHLIQVTKAVCSYTKNHVIEQDERLNYILVQCLSAIASKHILLEQESENMLSVRHTRMFLGQMLQDLHHSLGPIRIEYLNYLTEIQKQLQDLQLVDVNLQMRFEAMFPFYTFEVMQYYMQNTQLSIRKKLDPQKPLLVLSANAIKINTDFNLEQLKLLRRLLLVEEWKQEPIIQITWKANDETHNLTRFDLIFLRHKRTLVKRYHYSNGHISREKKEMVTDSLIFDAAEVGNGTVLVDGFKRL